AAMREQKGGDFELHITGVDELIATHDSIVFEACNTSFQMHLQLEPEDAVDQYNWAQLIAGPVLAATANSPLLFGKELWSETRIALFQQSIDVRNSSTLLREQHPRVTFGTRWLRQDVSEVLREDVVRFDLLLSAELDARTSMQVLDEGGIPALEALSLHNGTVYRWNRLCYGTGGDAPHIRIECRYVPSGPTILDEMANMALWTGLMCGMRDEHRLLWAKMPFRQAKANFFRAALSGPETKLNWFGRLWDTRELLERELLPLAEEGLRNVGTDRSDIRHYLGVIRQRLSTHTGSQWLTHAARALKQGYQKDITLRRATALMHTNAATGTPVGEWDPAHPDQLTGHELKLERVYQVMSTDLFTVRPEDLVDLAQRIMEWRAVHHVPVEDHRGALVGMVVMEDLTRELGSGDGPSERTVKEVMRTVLTIMGPNDAISDMPADFGPSGCIPVVHEGRLVGIVSKVDLERLGG
ncbi:MAG: CBS domain-containing protein, partial [Flavobacteriales bacterium]|nr:CBS domain-containing protein [Flavobacteriales bacterium]